MRIETWPLTGASAGTRREITLYRYSGRGPGPKVYLQAGLHADEMPGVLVLQHLMVLLDQAEAAGHVIGEILVVPSANPIGLSQWAWQKPLGRHDADSSANFNRGYPELAQLVGDDLDGKLTASAAENLHLIRAAFRSALARLAPRDDVHDMKIGLMIWSCDADYVLDLHCDHFAMLHFYASNARPDDVTLLGQATGAKLALLADISGGHAFDEAHSAPWLHLRDRFGDRYPIPAGCFATTLEYRGQFDVGDALAGQDAANLMTYLAAVGAVAGRGDGPRHDAPQCLPLAGAAEIFAPQGGVIAWQAEPGDHVQADQPLGHVTDPVSRRRMAISSPIAGLFFRCELWRSCLRGQSLAHVAGEKTVRSGDLLSD